MQYECYQCSDCDHCSQNLEEATLHAVQAHSDEREDYDDENEMEDEENEDSEELSRISMKGEKKLKYSNASKKGNSTNEKVTANSYHGGCRRLDMWNYECTEELITCVRERYHDLKNKLLRKKHIWEEIKDTLTLKVPDLTRVQCEQKWRNLLNAQRKYIVNCKLYGNYRLKKPEFFDDICQIVGDDIYKDLEVGTEIENSLTMKENKVNQLKRGLQESEDSLSQILQSAIDKKSSMSPNDLKNSEFLSTLTKLLSVLEKRELNRTNFQKEILEIERTKLSLLQKLIDTKEKQRRMDSELLSEWFIQQLNKRKKHDDDQE